MITVPSAFYFTPSCCAILHIFPCSISVTLFKTPADFHVYVSGGKVAPDCVSVFFFDGATKQDMMSDSFCKLVDEAYALEFSNGKQ